MSFVIRLRLVRSKLGANAIHLAIIDKSITRILSVTGYAHNIIFFLVILFILLHVKQKQFVHLVNSSVWRK